MTIVEVKKCGWYDLRLSDEAEKIRANSSFDFWLDGDGSYWWSYENEHKPIQKLGDINEVEKFLFTFVSEDEEDI